MHRRSLLSLPLALGASLASPLASPALGQDLRRKTLRIVPHADLAVLDPITTTAVISTNHGYNVFDTLYAVNGRMEPQPQMAEGHTVSDDGRAWTIRLREGLRFHDGAPVRAIDCAASIERWTKSIDTFGQILAPLVERYETPDERTLRIHLTRPFPLLIDALAKADACVPFIMPERLARSNPRRPLTEMVGSGPYEFVPGELVSGSRVVYRKFAGYQPRAEAPDWASGGKVAHFDRVEWHIVGDAATAQSALLTGEVDWLEAPIADLLPSLARNRQIRLGQIHPSGQLGLMRLNCLQPPFDNEKIRRALMQAINQEDYMLAVAGEDRSGWTTCPGLFPRGTQYYTENAAALMPGNSSAEAVRKAFAEAGYAGQKIVVLHAADHRTIEPLGQVTYDLLRRAGLNVELQAADWGTIASRRGNREPVDRGGWSIFHTYGTATVYGTPALSPLLRGNGAQGWFGWWQKQEVEDALQSWLYAPTPEQRRDIAFGMNRAAMQGAATIPLGQVMSKTAFRADITGIRPGNAPYPWGVQRA
ncbi:ABC transporter substrate-binding protein [Pseudoroseomonas deserti]|uniref:ABC transporter substrate-binding protein n=1 Tax=Teichococcus deserti TaxID=1817963 RepID=A0A1V2H4V4_9PROT|nr:ABC transporter substrate-binding protein [Pseudoroseomonas deserti]ONG56079.1 ABC transporter substrate-binding protein [Pseudoroseomonas deserti]